MIVTAEHCFKSITPQATRIEFFHFQYNRESDHVSYRVKEEPIYGSDKTDLVLLSVLPEAKDSFLSKVLPLEVELDWEYSAALDENDAIRLESSRVFLLGFPGGRTMIHSGECNIIRSEYLARDYLSIGIDCDASKGNSGSPVFDASSRRVVGVFWGGQSDGDIYDEATWEQHEVFQHARWLREDFPMYFDSKVLEDKAFSPSGQEVSEGYTIASLNYRMVKIGRGTFDMGNTDPSYSDERQHVVTLSRDFFLGESEVTQGMWKEIMGNNPSLCTPKCEDDYPVENVTWDQAVEFCNRLSELEGRTPAYTKRLGKFRWNPGSDGYRLPTEAEWEYAARAGRHRLFAGTDYPSQLCLYGNVLGGYGDSFPCDDGYPEAAPVKSFRANHWSLYDMSGNVGEWVWDVYNTYHFGGIDPEISWSRFGKRKRFVYRGGSWNDLPQPESVYSSSARLADRNRGWKRKAKFPTVGFRLARTSVGDSTR